MSTRVCLKYIESFYSP